MDVSSAGSRMNRKPCFRVSVGDGARAGLDRVSLGGWLLPPTVDVVSVWDGSASSKDSVGKGRRGICEGRTVEGLGRVGGGEL